MKLYILLAATAQTPHLSNLYADMGPGRFDREIPVTHMLCLDQQYDEYSFFLVTHSVVQPIELHLNRPCRLAPSDWRTTSRHAKLVAVPQTLLLGRDGTIPDVAWLSRSEDVRWSGVILFRAGVRPWDRRASVELTEMVTLNIPRGINIEVINEHSDNVATPPLLSCSIAIVIGICGLVTLYYTIYKGRCKRKARTDSGNASSPR